MNSPQRRDTISLRPATSDDLPAILAIEKACYPAPCVPWTEAAFQAEMTKDHSQFLVLTDDETDSVVMGYVVYWMLFDEAHILNVAVSPEWRGLGIGLKLVRQVIKAAVAKEFKRVFLEVRKSNDAAVALYQKLGFFIDHIKPRFYENGEDAYFMVRLLDPASNPLLI